nr:MAG TPA: hypothetical protein [Caudoviricetes sp.]
MNLVKGVGEILLTRKAKGEAYANLVLSLARGKCNDYRFVTEYLRY